MLSLGGGDDSSLLQCHIGLRKNTPVQATSSHERDRSLSQDNALEVRQGLGSNFSSNGPNDVCGQCATSESHALVSGNSESAVNLENPGCAE